jgi:hypothetical protein
MLLGALVVLVSGTSLGSSGGKTSWAAWGTESNMESFLMDCPKVHTAKIRVQTATTRFGFGFILQCFKTLLYFSTLCSVPFGTERQKKSLPLCMGISSLRFGAVEHPWPCPIPRTAFQKKVLGEVVKS